MKKLEVYSPAEDSFLLANVLEKEHLDGKDVLEVGCGSGFLTVLMAGRRARVTAIDLNSEAVEATKRLLDANTLKVKVFLSDLFEKVEGKFDMIVFNPPYLPDDESGGDMMYSGGPSGRETIEQFIRQSAGHLKTDGKVLLLISSLTGEQEVFLLFEKFGFSARAVAREKAEWEQLIVLEASMEPHIL